jgi:hypothetical protein
LPKGGGLAPVPLLEDDPGSLQAKKEAAVPPHWWIPVKASDPKRRKGDVENAVKGHGATLQSFWTTPDGEQLYALIAANQLDHNLLRDIGANGRPVPIEDV